MIGIILGVLGAIMGSVAFISPLNRHFSYFINSHFPNAELSESELVQLLFRGIINYDEYIERMKKLGYDENRSREIYTIHKKLLTAEELILAKRRGIISDEEYMQKMMEIGMNDDDIKTLEEITKYIPSVDDLIRFTVRDVFRNDRVEKYRLDDEFDKIENNENVKKIAKALGIDLDILKMYWRAHWQLPSPEQVIRMVNILQPDVLRIKLPDGSEYWEKYKMFNPNLKYEDIVTDYDTLSEYLAMTDISPFWRERMKALTFPPITRVDLRRLYEMGLIDDNECFARLLELGYSKLDAKRLLQFFKAMKNADQLKHVKSKIDDLYLEGRITKDEFEEYLMRLGYSKDEIELYEKYLQLEKKMKLRKEQLKVLEHLYKIGKISSDDLRDKLNKLGIKSSEINYYIALWTEKKSQKVKNLTKHDIEELFIHGIIDEEKAVELLRKNNYTDEDIKLIIELWKTKKSQHVS